MNSRNSSAILLRFALPALLALPCLAQERVLDRIVAVVGKEYILQSDLSAQTEFYAFSNKLDPSTRGLREQVLEAMVNEKLILADALQDTTLSVSDEEVNTQLDVLIAQRVQLPQIGSEKKLEEMYGMPISKMKREFRDDMRKQLLVQKLQQEKFGNLQASRREVEEFYATFKDSLPSVPEELELYHIFRVPKITDQSKNAIRSRAGLVRDSIKAGGDFADFARRYSQDKATASSGGDLGSWHRGQFVKEFEEVVFSLKEQEISDVVETSRGFHIIQLLERRGELVHARHILLKVGLDTISVAATTTFLQSLKDSIASGLSFSELAKRYSDDKESGAMGGLLGKYSIDQFDPSVVSSVKDLKPGGISAPVPVTTGSAVGYHILLLRNRIAPHTMNLQDDWKRIEQLAVGFKRNTEYQRWLKQLKNEIYWDTRL